ncbi:MAG: hypothetical protein AVDCRST_MAG68-3486 [uncultured Gemmatimonadetes bacterium]|uniref:NfeD-like C-terminal domain-containing protein n=1 Tax=uncultured Gemmatimonadota bacterium TaxID=203437 RepID=A0A6J4M3L1_9BACT|nr:MAG: hypothetical protein AVDCRST_MAG68-3486 [uncultured Gemmatimonadota bacterium]
MDIYLFSLVLGALGLVAMAAAGLGHHGAHSGNDAGDVSHGHGDHGGHGVKDGTQHQETGGHAWVWQFLSPRVLFSVLVGLGATGLLAQPFLGGVLLFLLALAGGVAFEAALVRPIWNFLFRFASTPALTLESSLLDTGTAVTRFDASGSGLIALEVDGQVLQVLATLRPEDRARGLAVRAGDQLLVEEVDGARNRCVVSWAGPPLPAAANIRGEQER